MNTSDERYREWVGAFETEYVTLEPPQFDWRVDYDYSGARMVNVVSRTPIVANGFEAYVTTRANDSEDSAPWTWKDWALLFTAWPFLLTARIVWQFNPGIWACSVFWVIAMADEPLRWSEMRRRRRMFYGMTMLGASLNAIATLANGGVMPVLDLQEQKSLWVPLNEHTNLPWLCDIFAGASLGDLFIFAGLIALLVNWLLEKSRVLEPEPPVKGKRLPGIGIG